jgi:fatty-acyl-CoA synthase
MSADAVIAHCRGKVASFKLPKRVAFLDEFPMTASGKIRKVDLRADAAERFNPS